MSLTLRLAHLYPQHLNLYGDRGNVLALLQRMQWRGYTLEVHNIDLGASPQLDAYDLYFMGGGQDAQQLAVEADLHQHKADALRAAAEAGAVFLTICGGYQLLGYYYKPHQGRELQGLSLIDAYTVAGPNRMIGNVLLERPDGSRVVGFENHSGQTFLGEAVAPLGRVIQGYGNNGTDAFEGVVAGAIYGTYLHGALLPKNPNLTDELLLKALQYRYGSQAPSTLSILDDTLEQRASQQVQAQLLGAV